MGVTLVEDGAALLSMRNSDFDAFSAFGEVIDNSVQAEGEKIQIRVHYAPSSGKKKFEPVNRIAFGDDGTGMDAEILHRCLQLGYSSRYNDRSGIGRFGVGMTLGAISQCKKVEVYSKEKGSDWIYTYIDLDDVTSRPPKMTEIPKPIKKKIPEEYFDIVGKEKGTLVIWSKYDRQQISATEMLTEMHIWIGRTFRHFLWKGVSIYINGDIVKAIDPLYVNTDMTKFSEDPKAEEFDPIKFHWPIPREDLVPGGQHESEITIRMSFLPQKFRTHRGSASSKENLSRYTDMNEGISIVRNQREVFYGHIPYWPQRGWFIEPDRWWGCEISFNAVLDKDFTVKNIKRGAIPVTELKRTICDLITPTRKTVLEKTREVWDEADAKKASERSAEGIDTGHSEAEKAAERTSVPKNVIDVDKNLNEEAGKIADTLLKGLDEKKKALWIAKFKSQPFTIIDDQWKGPEFMETNHLGGKDVLKYNMRHTFFNVFKEVKNSIEAEGDEAEQAKKLKALIDLLLISYSKAEAMFDKGLEMESEKFIEQLRMNWGHYLTNYIETWKKGL